MVDAPLKFGKPVDIGRQRLDRRAFRHQTRGISQIPYHAKPSGRSGFTPRFGKVNAAAAAAGFRSKLSAFFAGGLIVSTKGSTSSPSPRQWKCPPTDSRMSSYSRLARIHGGSLSSSRISQLLEMILASLSACPSAFLAGSETSASSPHFDQLS